MYIDGAVGLLCVASLLPTLKTAFVRALFESSTPGSAHCGTTTSTTMRHCGWLTLVVAGARAVTPAELAAQPAHRPTLLAAARGVLDRLKVIYTPELVDGYIKVDGFYAWQSMVTWSTFLDYQAYSGEDRYTEVLTALNMITHANSDMFPGPAGEVMNNDDALCAEPTRT